MKWAWSRRSLVLMGNLALVCVVSILCILAAEAGLYLAGAKPAYRLFPRAPELVPWLVSTPETGLHYVSGKFRADWPINRDGYAGLHDFTAEVGAESNIRVLLCGDSFTFGVRASCYAKSFASLMETALNQYGKTAVWNTGIPGSGQKQELWSLKKYFPRLNPQVVLLVFCMNDFDDNLYPIDNYYVYKDGSWVYSYELLPDGATRLLTPEAAYSRAMTPRTKREYLCTSRVGCKLAAFLDVIRGKSAPYKSAPIPTGMSADFYAKTRVSATKRLLSEIKEYVESRKSKLLLAAIPGADELRCRCPKCVFDLCDELGIATIELGPSLTPGDYVADGHWNDSGHAKVAAVLAKAVRAFVKP